MDVKTALLRRGNEVFEIDLYELLNKNNTDLDIYLRLVMQILVLYQRT